MGHSPNQSKAVPPPVAPSQKKTAISKNFEDFCPFSNILLVLCSPSPHKSGAATGKYRWWHLHALLLDLQAMDLLWRSVDVKDVVLDKSKIDREKSRMKLKSDEKHKEDQEKLVCIGVDGKIDTDTLMYREVMDDNGETKLKTGKGEEHHLTFTKEPGTESGTYLTHRVIPVKDATAAILTDEVHSVLKEFNIFHTLKAVLVDNTNTNTGCEGDLVTILENKTQWKLHSIGCSLHQYGLPFRAVSKHLDGSTKSLTDLVHWENSVKLTTMICPRLNSPSSVVP